MSISSMPLGLIGIRALKTFFQTFIALLGLDTAQEIVLPTKTMLVGAFLAAIISAFMNTLADLESRFR